ncbi:hypothetical protein NS334_00125 [Sphingomonas endophytica]|uniref:Uncharacterized protein n=1 Tax=Sphingomonas endophytica TaxID=869719 RepID=A0A147I9X7_9SPHN|nr:hypothetical protein NS334_00125 [Sphingomonas endophytica]
MYVWSKRTKDGCQGGPASDQHTNINDPALAEGAEGVEVSVERLILAVPLQVEGDTVFDIVDFVTIQKSSSSELTIFRRVELSAARGNLGLLPQ